MCTTKEADYILFKCIQSKANEPLLEKTRYILQHFTWKHVALERPPFTAKHGHNSKEK